VIPSLKLRDGPQAPSQFAFLAAPAVVPRVTPQNRSDPRLKVTIPDGDPITSIGIAKNITEVKNTAHYVDAMFIMPPTLSATMVPSSVTD
jgi:hypothetical protein